MTIEAPTRLPRANTRIIAVRVLTYVNHDTDEPETDFTIDIADPERREWLYGKHLFWAILNHRFVELYNIVDEPK